MEFGNDYKDRKIGFKTLLTGLTGFMAHLEIHVAEIHNKIPIYFMDTGDGSYYDKRFEKVDNKTIYNSVPRMIVKLDQVENDIDATASVTDIKYLFNNKLYQAEFLYNKIDFPIIVNFVTSNFIFGMEYFEMLLTIFNNPSVFTYEYMGNTLEGKYDNKSYNFEFPIIETSSKPKNFIINFQVNLHLPLYVARYKTIQELNPKTGKLDKKVGVKIALNSISEGEVENNISEINGIDGENVKIITGNDEIDEQSNPKPIKTVTQTTVNPNTDETNNCND